METEKIESIIESLLFVAGEPLSARQLNRIIREAPKKEVAAALKSVIKRWDAPDRGLRVIEIAGGYQFQTVEDNAPWVGKMLQTRPVRLSRASLESLAIIAYRQPVTRPEVEEVRGVDSGGVLKTLLEYGFIKIAGRKDVPGKPLIYTTDKRFMEFFRLKSLGELPTLRELSEIQEERLAEAQDQGLLPLEDEGGEEGAAVEASAEQEAGVDEPAAENDGEQVPDDVPDDESGGEGHEHDQSIADETGPDESGEGQEDEVQ